MRREPTRKRFLHVAHAQRDAAALLIHGEDADESKEFPEGWSSDQKDVVINIVLMSPPGCWAWGWRWRLLADDHLCGSVKISRPRVVTKPGPLRQNLVEPGVREGLNGRKDPHPAPVIWEDRRNTRLLQHDLGNQDRIWIACPPPGQIALVPGVPSG